MGCTASKTLETMVASKDEPGHVQYGHSVSVPAAEEHHYQSKNDSNHMVALKSSTYGILKTDPPPLPQQKQVEKNGHGRRSQSSTAAEIYEKLKNYDVADDMVMKPWSEVSLSLPKLPPVAAAAVSPSWRVLGRGEPEMINTWELMDGLEEDSPGSASFEQRKSSRNTTGLSKVKPFEKSQDDSSTLPIDDTTTTTKGNKIVELGTEGSSKTIKLESSSSSSSSTKAPLQVKEVKRVKKPDPLESFEANCPPGGEERVVLYTTTLRGIRKTFEDCNHVRFILQSLGVSIDERDVSLHAEFRQELKELADKPLAVPRVFIMGRYIGGAEEVSQLHDDGTLAVLVEGLPSQTSREGCDGCGGVRFVPCSDCNGSCKLITDMNEVIRCPECNENGLMRCPICD
ncbi:unnamed protein product [Sphagnum jensenii]|uniref:Glutaredoxin domain-containing protein n=1 Tax=Sphagnum jensenii TaxID=128206 RepID=A0ABP0WIU3_9BRYO